MNVLSKRQKREKKNKLAKKIQQEVRRLERDKMIKDHAHLVLEQKQNPRAHGSSILTPNESPDLSFVVNYVADRNGCGYFRCIWPFELLATYKNMMSMNCFVYQTDPSLLSKVHTLRFQRQATDSQTLAWNNYFSLRSRNGFKYKIQYEIDDLLMEIAPHNKIAYDYFDEQKKQNHLHMLRTADSITFSTEPLKEIYVNDYGIDPNKIRVVRNFLPQFLYSLPYRNSVKEFNTTDQKPRIFWAGSASHVGKGGDLEFLMPLIEKTFSEYQWVFQGVLPPELIEHHKAGKVEFIPWTPVYGLANVQFYRARPDICLAPLVPSRFNSAKSDLKYLESCALGAPCICTSFSEKGMKSPYDLINAEICLEPDADIWKTMIDHLINNPDYYMQTVKTQYEFLNGRWMENNLDQWVDALK